MKNKKVEVIVKKSDEKYDAAVPNLGIGAQARECIMKGFNFYATYELIKKNVPNTQFSKKCYYWYRNDLKKKGAKVPVALHPDKKESKAATK